MLCCFSSSGTVIDPPPPDPVGSCRLQAVNSIMNPFPATAFNHIPIGTGAQWTAQNDQRNVDLRKAPGFVLNVNIVHAGDLIQSAAGDPLVQIRQRSNNSLTTTLRVPANWPSWGATNEGDRPCTIYDPILDEAWQFYHFSRANLTTGLHDGAFQIFLTGIGTGKNPRMSSSASTICHCAVMYWAGDWNNNTASGPPYIEHSLSLILSRKAGLQQLGKTFRFPAFGTDGIGAGENLGSVPYGAGFALPMPQFGGPADSVFSGMSFRQMRFVNTLRRYPAFVVDGTSGNIRARGFGVWLTAAKTEMQSAFVAMKPHLRMIENIAQGQSAWGGGTPLAPNCGWNSGAPRI